MDERVTEALRIYKRFKTSRMSWFTLEESLFLHELFHSEGSVQGIRFTSYALGRLKEMEKKFFL